MFIGFKAAAGQTYKARFIDSAGNQVGADVTTGFTEITPGKFTWQSNGGIDTTWEGEVRILLASDNSIVKRIPHSLEYLESPSSIPLPHSHAESDITNLATDLAAKESTANKNAASGYAGLDASSKLTGSQQVYGSAANTACVGNDARLSDARVPSGAAGGDLAGSYPNPTIKASVALTTPNIGAATGTALAATGAITSSGTAGIGYATGAGGTVTQSTSKSTGVTLNKLTGTITLNAAALASATIVTFTVTNSTVAATDVIVAQHDSVGTTGAYTISPNTPAAGSFKISVRNNTGASLSEAIVIRFLVLKSVAA